MHRVQVSIYRQYPNIRRWTLQCDVSKGDTQSYEAEERRERHTLMATCLLSRTCEEQQLHRAFPVIGMRRAS